MSTVLPPGRELDAVVAEKVMGWRRGLLRRKPLHTDVIPPGQSRPWRDYSQVGDHPYIEAPNGKKWFLCAYDCNVMDLVSRLLPQCSTDISAALEVVEKMREKGFRFRLDVTEDGSCAEFRRGEARFWGGSDIISHAICLAALKSHEPR